MTFMRWIQQMLRPYKDRLQPLLEGVAEAEATAAQEGARVSSSSSSSSKVMGE